MKPNVNGRGLKWLFTAAVLLALFTGFGNMPLYGRYYIANIPGFQWSGNFIVNMKVHLVAGADLVGIVHFAPSPRHLALPAAAALAERARGRAGPGKC